MQAIFDVCAGIMESHTYKPCPQHGGLLYTFQTTTHLDVSRIEALQGKGSEFIPGGA